jgi:TRAP-type C4-dicarboxylate transport system substrate-binding protein
MKLKNAPTANLKFKFSQHPHLGKETDINQGLTLGTVDMIISGPSFAARAYPRFGIAYYPFIFRDGDHLIAYSKSPVFAEMVNEFRAKTGIQVTAYTYYGARHTTAQKAFHQLRRHEGHQDSRARRSSLPSHT